MKTGVFRQGPVALSIVIVAAVLFALGCSDDNGTSSSGGSGRLLVLMHDAPVDSLAEVWLTVTSLRLIGGNDDDSTGNGKNEMLVDSVRLNLADLDSITTLLAADSMPAQTFSKIRLEVTDPEFVSDSGTVITSDQIKLVANGKIDLNFQGPVTIAANTLTVLDIDFDLEASVQINQTGNEKFILHPQVFVEANLTGSVDVVLDSATITLVDATGPGLLIQPKGSTLELPVIVGGSTEYYDAADQPIAFGDLSAGMIVIISGALNTETGEITATEIRLTS